MGHVSREDVQWMDYAVGMANVTNQQGIASAIPLLMVSAVNLKSALVQRTHSSANLI
jgi:hypothetical protein